MKTTALLFIALLLGILPFMSRGAENSVLKQTPTLTLKMASRMIEVAVRRADELNEQVTIVIIGTDGLPLTLRRHESSPGIIYERALQQAEDAWLENKGPGTQILWEKQRIGGIGVSGASETSNQEISTVAYDVLIEAFTNKNPVLCSNKELLKVILYVRASEIIETADFYRDAIGLQQLSPSAAYGWIVFNAGAVNICLREKDKTSLRNKATNLALYSGTRKDVEALYNRLLEAGYNEKNQINPERDKTMGRLQQSEAMTTFWIKDPAGNTIQIESLRKK